MLSANSFSILPWLLRLAVSCVQTWYYFNHYRKVHFVNIPLRLLCLHFDRMSGISKSWSESILPHRNAEIWPPPLGCRGVVVRHNTPNFDISHWWVLAHSCEHTHWAISQSITTSSPITEGRSLSTISSGTSTFLTHKRAKAYLVNRSILVREQRILRTVADGHRNR